MLSPRSGRPWAHIGREPGSVLEEQSCKTCDRRFGRRAAGTSHQKLSVCFLLPCLSCLSLTFYLSAPCSSPCRPLHLAYLRVVAATSQSIHHPAVVTRYQARLPGGSTLVRQHDNRNFPPAPDGMSTTSKSGRVLLGERVRREGGKDCFVFLAAIVTGLFHTTIALHRMAWHRIALPFGASRVLFAFKFPITA